LRCRPFGLLFALAILFFAGSAFGMTTPFISASTSFLPGTATTMTITGTGFDATAAHNSITFNDGVIGTITAATTTQLTVALSHSPTGLGNLTAVVTTDGQSSGAPTQVATVNIITTFSSIADSAGSVTLNFTGVANTTYGLQFSSTLSSSSWSNIGPVTTNGTGVGQYVDSSHPSGTGFYRLIYPAP
jgi:hypothetical protein